MIEDVKLGIIKNGHVGMIASRVAQADHVQPEDTKFWSIFLASIQYLFVCAECIQALAINRPFIRYKSN